MRFALMLLLTAPIFAQDAKIGTATPAPPKPAASSAKPAVAATATGAKIRKDPKDGLTYVWVAPGTYALGCPPDDGECYSWEELPHAVSIRNGFWIGTTEVTQTAYQAITKVNPSSPKGPGLPVNQINYFAARNFCVNVGKRLPTEDEWEYAARALTNTPRYGSVDLVAWYNGNSLNEPHAVGTKQANKFGLYDMLGNLWEWVEGTYAPLPDSHILRGGGFLNSSRDLRASNRLWMGTDMAHRDIGFRCVADE